MENILILGGAGYTGSALTHLLVKKKYNVTVVDNFLFKEDVFNTLFKFENFNVIKKDVRDIEESFIKKFDVIFPLAAIVGAPACEKYKFDAISINKESLKKICSYTSKGQKIIYPTTNSGYGATSGEIECDENTPLNPISLYGKLKKEVEEIVMSRENSISFRLATVFGVAPRHRTDLLVNDFVYKAMNDRSLVLFEENFKRNFVHVDDVAEAYLYSIEKFSELKNNIYNLGLSTANLTKKELALKIKEYLPNTEIISSEIGKDPDKRNYIVSNEKIEKAGFRAKRSLDLGIKELIKYYSFITKKNSNI